MSIATDVQQVQPAINMLPLNAYKIAGTTTREGVAGPQIVRLYARLTGLLLRADASDANGAFEFPSLNNTEYQLIATDMQNEFEPAVADRITPVSQFEASE